MNVFGQEGYKYIPTQYIDFDLSKENLFTKLFKKTTTGLASGNCFEEAVCHALFELLGRHYTACFKELTWEEREKLTVDKSSVVGKENSILIDKLDKRGIDLTIYLIQGSGDIPAFSAMITSSAVHAMPSFAGYGAHVDKSIALCRALTEAVQSRLTYLAGTRDDMLPWQYQHQSSRTSMAKAINYTDIASLSFSGFNELLSYLVTDRKPAKPFIFNVSGRTGHMKIFKKQH